jgi:putative peptidoglycan lipid II flippase
VIVKDSIDLDNDLLMWEFFMELEEAKGVSKGAFSFFSGTFISRISGLGRDVSMAFCFGTHPAIAAFMVAYRFSHLFRRVLGEATLSSGFIPYFEGLRKEAPKEGARFFRDVFFSLFLFLVGLIFLVVISLWLLLEYGQFSVENQEILYLTILMLPGLLFICLYALSSALLQCERKFFLAGVAPVLFNVAWIVTVFLFRNSLPSVAVVGLSGAVVFGFFLQWVLLVPSIKLYLRGFLSWREIVKFRFFSKEVKALLSPVFLGLVGVSATQVNSLLDVIFARYASLEGPAYLWYAIRIQQLPLALFGVALSSALLPPLARAVSKKDWNGFSHLLRFSMSKSFHFIFPCTIALFVLAFCGVNLLYGRGDFGQEAISETVLCLWGYGIGLLPYVFVLLLAPAFYAQKNFRHPMKAAIYSVILNVALNAFFVMGLNLGAMSVAISTSLSAWFNFFYLSKALDQKKLFEPGIFRGALCALIAGVVSLLFGYLYVGDSTILLLVKPGRVNLSRQITSQLLQFFLLTGAFGLSFVASAWLLDVKEILSILRIKRRQKLRG